MTTTTPMTQPTSVQVYRSEKLFLASPFDLILRKLISGVHLSQGITSAGSSAHFIGQDFKPHARTHFTINSELIIL